MNDDILIFEELPGHILELCRKRAEEQGVKLDLKAIVTKNKRYGGFDWDETEEGYYFWEDVISNQNFQKILASDLDCIIASNCKNFVMKNKLDKAVFECYRELYKAATPSADFDKLLEEAPVNERGEKVIDFMAYEIEQEKMDEIIQKIITKYKIKPDKMKSAFSATIYLGASPKTKMNNDEIDKTQL